MLNIIRGQLAYEEGNVYHASLVKSCSLVKCNEKSFVHHGPVDFMEQLKRRLFHLFHLKHILIGGEKVFD